MMLTVLIAGTLFGLGALFAAIRLVRDRPRSTGRSRWTCMLAIVVGVIVLLAAVSRQLDHPGHRRGRLAAGLHRLGQPGQAAARDRR